VQNRFVDHERRNVRRDYKPKSMQAMNSSPHSVPQIVLPVGGFESPGSELYIVGIGGESRACLRLAFLLLFRLFNGLAKFLDRRHVR
jgi:hypothetical protein